MAIIKPFKALRPKQEISKQLVSPPYDVLNSEEARVAAKDNPLSFLHITKSEIDLPARYMKCLILFILVIIQISYSQAQTKKRFSLEINYGAGGNFFVRSYPENAPPPVMSFYKKNFIGSVGGFEVKYNITTNSSVGLAYAKSVNKREITYDIGGNATILYFHITHINHFYQLYYETALSKKIKHFKLHGGIYYLRMNQQEVDAAPGGALFEERDFEHNKLEEGGCFLVFISQKKLTQNLI